MVKVNTILTKSTNYSFRFTVKKNIQTDGHQRLQSSFATNKFKQKNCVRRLSSLIQTYQNCPIFFKRANMIPLAVRQNLEKVGILLSMPESLNMMNCYPFYLISEKAIPMAIKVINFQSLMSRILYLSKYWIDLY